MLLQASTVPDQAKYANIHPGALQSIPETPLVPTSSSVSKLSQRSTPSLQRSSDLLEEKVITSASRISSRSAARDVTHEVAKPPTVITPDALNVSEDDTLGALLLEQLPEIPEEPEGDGEVEEDVQDIGSGQPDTTRIPRAASVKKVNKTSLNKNAKPTLPERRSSVRATRHSISNISEVLNSGESSPTAEPDLSRALASTSVGVTKSSPSDATYELDASSELAGQKGGRSGKKQSVPRESNKRKRTTTPQAQHNRAVSPAHSDRSRSKRIKTEEAETSVGTPGKPDDAQQTILLTLVLDSC